MTSKKNSNSVFTETLVKAAVDLERHRCASVVRDMDVSFNVDPSDAPEAVRLARLTFLRAIDTTAARDQADWLERRDREVRLFCSTLKLALACVELMEQDAANGEYEDTAGRGAVLALTALVRSVQKRPDTWFQLASSLEYDL